MGYIGDLQNNGGNSWSKYRDITITAPAQALDSGYSVKLVATGTAAAAIYAASQVDGDDVRIEHNITAPTPTTLNGAITSTQTTVTLSATTGYPVAGMIIIDTERVSYVGISSNVLQNCVRGASGTTAAAHNSGATIAYVKEMERHIVSFTSANITLWFKTREDVVASGSNTNYRLYYGNNLAGAAPATLKSVFVRDIPNLVIAWNLDELGGTVINDRSGSGINGTLINGAGATWGEARFGGGIRFSGTDDYIDIVDNNITWSNGISIDARIKVVDNATSYNSNITLGNGWANAAIVLRAFSITEMNFFVNADNGLAATGLTMTDNYHHYFAMLDSAGLQSIYQDNVLKNSRTGQALPTNVNRTFNFIGAESNGGGKDNSAYTEIRIYNRGLTTEERDAIYNNYSQILGNVANVALIRKRVAGDTIVIDGNFTTVGAEQEPSSPPPDRTISVKFIAS